MAGERDARWRLLVVGAGSVGQVYGRHAHLGGAEVTFYVKEAHRAEVEAGFTLYPRNEGPKASARLEGCQAVTTAAEVAAQRFDAALLTVSSHALEGEWLPELLAALGDATIVMLQPGQDDRATIVAAGADEERLVAGMISLLAYEAPLPGEAAHAGPGTGYWFPPLTPGTFVGPEERADEVVHVLHNGGQPAKRVKGGGEVQFLAAIMTGYLSVLEAAGWRFAAITKERAVLGARGAAQAMAIVATTAGPVPPPLRAAGRPGALRTLAALIPRVPRRVVPVPLEAYLERHFTKVGPQTRLHLAAAIERGRAAGLPVDALEELAALTEPVARAEVS